MEALAINKILNDLGLIHLLDVFTDNSVGPPEVLTLTDSEFNFLGVSAIGDRARLRQRCRTYLNGQCESPSLKKFKELSEKKKTQNNNKFKSNRRLYTGWKLSTGQSFKLVPLSQGGGSIIMDLPKEYSLPDLQKKMIATFFPDGQAVHKNIKLSHCETFIGNFAGERVPSRLLNGDLFSLDGYFSEIKSNPVRLYLYAKTTTVNQPPSPSTSTTTLNQQTSATLNQPPSPSTSSTTLNQQPSATCTQPPSSSTSSTTLNQQTSATCTQPPSSSTSSTTLNQQTSATCTQPQLAINAVNYATNIINDDTDDELPDISFYSGTPTITFKKSKKAESLEEILVRLNSQIKNEKNIINVSRGDVLSGTRRAFSRKTFRPEFG
ncbi:uncharacterized protein LOC126818298 isoform X1 [Patella vulgata]|nr:uncharacterized protein LOC126818298 isoform X1 [Patella vulgata]XP_055956315.1 uncharacterized protein LOC126818298 isoform X1 [Patella vulgata]